MISQRKCLESKLVICLNYFLAIAQLQSLSVLCLCFFEIAFSLTTTAQIVPDNTLGAESSVVTPITSPSPRRSPPNSQQVEQFLIEKGAIRDRNLFHSFQEFNINLGQQVNFSNPEGIINILTRVTGNNASQILGNLGVNGDANLFLINPHGIIFSEGANIDLNGAFFATTAESIIFADGSSFSAVNPNVPPLLTISIPVGLQLGNNPQAIQAQKVTFKASDVTLIGGEIDLQYAKIKAPGGDVFLGSLANAGAINFAENFPEAVNKGNITIGDRSLITTISDFGGNITIEALNLNVEDSSLQTGIAKDKGNANTRSGNIDLNATEDIYLANSTIKNDANLNSLGNIGKISITAQNLTLDNSRISSSTDSIGNAGDIEVKLTEKFQVISNPETNEPGNLSPRFQRKGLFSNVDPFGKGNGGNISVEAREISLSGLGGIAASTRSSGNGGTITVKSDRISLDRGATISANTNGTGDGGTIAIEATDSIIIDDAENTNRNPEGRILPGGIIADVRRGAEGNSGNIAIETGSLEVLGGALITTDTKGSGDGGNIAISARESITVQNTSNRSSQIVSAVRSNATGSGGNTTINTTNLKLLNGGMINAETESSGNAGDVSIFGTGTIELRGTSVESIPSQILAQVGRDASGEGGNIDLFANNLIVTDGGQVSASTLGTGIGGNVAVEVKETTSVTGFAPILNKEDRRARDFIGSVRGTIPSGIFASSPGEGDANALSIETSSLILTDKARISVSSKEQGAAGNLTIKADRIQLNNAVLSAESVEGEEANIFLYGSELRLRDRSRITTNATKTATGGNITIEADTLVAMENSDITANATGNFGGRVIISAEGVFGVEVREKPSPESDITASSRLGTQFNGVVKLNTPDADPVSGAIELPENFTDAADRIAAGCSLDKENSFVVTGRGGLPTNPQEFLRGQALLQDWRVSNSEQFAIIPIPPFEGKRGQVSQQLVVGKNHSPIVEAEKLIINSQGMLELTVADLYSDRNLLPKNTSCQGVNHRSP